jgi:manganese efflux pump family protein
MSIWTILLIALALAMDAFAVAIASGFAMRQLRVRHALAMAASFGAFQAIMPLIGWFSGIKLRGWMLHVDHWVAFGLLTFVGGKMIAEAFEIEEQEKKTNPFALHVLLVLSVATSIDALAAGLSFALLDVAITAPVLIIGAVTFCMSLAGVAIGARGGHLFEKKIEVLGGVILIGIGLKILLSHLLGR